MKVARETILVALEDMIQLEEISTQNLMEVDRYDLSCFGKKGEGEIRNLLGELNEDAEAHRNSIFAIMEKLRGKK
jgi:hypothetical protein